MQLTQFADYSFRVLIYLSRLPESGTATITEIADYFQISRNHLVKVVNNLANQGFINTTRGKGGGMKLSRPAHSIGVGEVFRAAESNLELVECFNADTNRCCITQECGLMSQLYQARRAFMAELDRYTLADAARRNHPALAIKPESPAESSDATP